MYVYLYLIHKGIFNPTLWQVLLNNLVGLCQELSRPVHLVLLLNTHFITFSKSVLYYQKITCYMVTACCSSALLCSTIKFKPTYISLIPFFCFQCKTILDIELDCTKLWAYVGSTDAKYKRIKLFRNSRKTTKNYCDFEMRRWHEAL